MTAAVVSDAIAPETTLEVVSDGHRLEGTLCRPAGADTAILLVGGSGAHDRNQAGRKLELHVFDALARQLATAGVATLRYDKRGCGESEGTYIDAGHTDAVAWFDRLREEFSDDGNRLYALGHSEGTLICPQIVARRSDVAGQILITPMLERFALVIERQARQVLAEISGMAGPKGVLTRLLVRVAGDQIRKQKRLLERVRNTDASSFRFRLKTVNAKWLREMDALDPVALHASVDVPTLVVAAGKDLQCRPEDAERLGELHPDTVHVVTVPDLMHLLRAEPEEPAFLRYAELMREPLDERVGEIVIAWLRGETSTGNDETPRDGVPGP